MIRRHFFLAIAIGIVGLMAILGGLRLLTGNGHKADGQGGGAAVSASANGKGGGGRGGRGGQGGPGGGFAPQVTPATAQMHVFTDRLEVIGVAKARQSVTLTSQTTEIATKINFTSGQYVKKGQVLAELKTDEQQAAVTNATVALEKARRDNERWQELGKRGFAPKADLDQYQAAYEQAKANLATAQSRLHDRVIRAPFAGTIGLSDAAPGMLIQPGTPIATLDDLAVINVDFDVPERFVGTVRAGTPITATADAFQGVSVAGVIERIDTRVKADTRSVTARARFSNPGGRIKPGMLMKVGVQQGTRNGVGLPEAAVQFSTDQPFVFALVQQNGKLTAVQKTIVVGVRQDGWVEVRNGLAAGETVVGDGLNRIQPNQTVRLAGGGHGAGGQGDGAQAGAQSSASGARSHAP